MKYLPTILLVTACEAKNIRYPEDCSVEVPYDSVDNDCDPATPDDDLDDDGLLGAEDCDDENPYRRREGDQERGDTTLYEQSEIDAFCGGWCTMAVNPAVRVHASDATNLRGLGCLSAAEGVEVWYTVRLQDLSGLEGLSTLGDLSIANNDSLTSLTALGEVAMTDGSLIISENFSLQSLAGLEGVTALHELMIVGNESLKSLDGLDSLTSVEAGVSIYDNPLLSEAEVVAFVDRVSE